MGRLNILVFAEALRVLLYICIYTEQMWFTVFAAEKEDASEKLVINNLPLGTKAVDVRALVSSYGKVWHGYFNLFPPQC
jgi:hypothetical protein